MVLTHTGTVIAEPWEWGLILEKKVPNVNIFEDEYKWTHVIFDRFEFIQHPNFDLNIPLVGSEYVVPIPDGDGGYVDQYGIKLLFDEQGNFLGRDEESVKQFMANPPQFEMPNLADPDEMMAQMEEENTTEEPIEEEGGEE